MGALDVLAKPVSRDQLLAAINRLNRPVRRLLIADDDPEVARLFRRMLRSQLPSSGFLEAYNGEEALDLMRAERPDLVLLDLKMPGVDGAGVLDVMASDTDLSDIPAIVVSVKAEDYLTAPLEGSISIARQGGFRLHEIARVLQALTLALEPVWVPPGDTAPALARAPAG